MTILLARKLLLALCTVGLVGLAACGDPSAPGNAPGAGGGDGRPHDQEDVGGADIEVDYGGFTIAPPQGPDDPNDPYDGFDEKMARLLESTEVPSTFAGAFLQLSRAYLSERAPLTEVEESAFAVFERASPEVLRALERTLARIDELPSEDMERLYAASFIWASPSVPLTREALATSVAFELRARANLAEFGETDPEFSIEEERPGLIRETACRLPHDQTSGRAPCPNVCRIQTESMGESIRTGNYVPKVSNWQPSEVERVNLPGGGWINVEPPDCKVEATSADGSSVCLAVPRVSPGELVRLEGFNFHDLGATVELWSIHNEVFVAEAHVRGDETASADAPVDCQISDVIVFELPQHIPTGRYNVEVRVLNPDFPGTPELPATPMLNAKSYVHLDVVPPVTTNFQLAVEELASLNDTDGEWFSDEIGVRIVTIPILDNGDFGEMNTDDSLDFDFGDVDRGETRCLGDVRQGGQCVGRTVFTGPLGAGFVFSMIGYEIDKRDYYEATMREFLQVVEDVTKSNWDHIALEVGAFAGIVAGYIGGPATGKLVGALVAAAIKLTFEAWAPPDLIIEDWGSQNHEQMAELTSVNFPVPPVTEYASAHDVKVVVEPCEGGELSGCDGQAKLPGQYRESRRYGKGLRDSCEPPLPPFMTQRQCELIGSEFQITFRYNRLD